MFFTDKEVVAEHLRTLEARHNLTHAEMARKLGLEYHTYYAYIRTKEEKITLPPIDVLANVCLIFDVSIEWLIGITEEGGVWQ